MVLASVKLYVHVYKVHNLWGSTMIVAAVLHAFLKLKASDIPSVPFLSNQWVNGEMDAFHINIAH